ncbi:MAG: 16S rRNA (uracil(1498)-N(3))-methyltransferase [Actinomycetaceae bacterium]|nr:16S rRNA (uracil(1498)-N(3))-methyltransferase [Actinomycetaceae bacterium]
MTLPVFFGEHANSNIATCTPALSEARTGNTLTWEGTEARHCIRVRRMKTGEQLELIDGEGLRVLSTIRDIRTSAVTLTIDHISKEPASDTQIVLVQGLAKGGRDEQALEAATEIGVDQVIPWSAVRCVSQWVGKKREKGQQKWTNIVTAATKQARRAFIPHVDELVDSPQLAQRIAAGVQQGDAVYVLWEESDQPFVNEIRTMLCRNKVWQRVWLIIGPEGGITAEEIDMFVHAGAKHMKLGKTIMRVSSAGPAAIAALACACGRWDSDATCTQKVQ